uniref:NADH-ubiquinone oxidoreductase chain 2 n=1 Tax=Macroxyela ferruginea TaxID=48208 RepID=A0A6G5ZVE4_9HYME|nr:NADH dehydrogenase subunit 2 [Macroxyela ferruginea]QHR79720.1 NADH dehydrogenase subunit 2 [Macroxyela ferruginea]
MFNKNYKIIFLMSLMMGTIISITSNSWFSVWMGLEINLLSFMPLISNSKMMNSTEASLKYFLSQTIASSVLLLTSILLTMSFYMENEFIYLNLNKYMYLMFMCSLLMKMGAAPFHFWFPGVMEGLTWSNCFILMTWQKIAPIMLMFNIINLTNMMMLIIIIIFSMIVGTIGGLNQTSLRKLMAYSSINHLSWMMTSLMANEHLWMIYMTIYTLLSLSIIYMMNLYNLSYINQIYSFKTNNKLSKFSFMLMMLSLGGLPPFLGFLPKWLIIQMLIKNNLNFLPTIMVMMTLITLFYYMRISFSAFMLSYSENKWKLMNNIKNFNNNKMLKFNFINYNLILSFTSMTGLIMSTMMNNWY